MSSSWSAVTATSGRCLSSWLGPLARGRRRTLPGRRAPGPGAPPRSRRSRRWPRGSCPRGPSRRPGPVTSGSLAVGDDGGHAAHGEGAAVVAGLDQQLGVGAHEGRGHGHRGAVRQHKLLAGVAEVLDDAEQVVPAAGVQAGGVVPEFVEDLVHLERGGDGLDQDGGADGALRDAEVVLGEDEDLVPEPGLEVALHLGQVVVRAVAVLQQLPGHVEEVQAEVHQRAHGVFAVDQQVPSRACASRAGGPPPRPAGRRCGGVYSLPSGEV